LDAATMVFSSFFTLSALTVFTGRFLGARAQRVVWVTAAHLPGYYSVYQVWREVASSPDHVFSMRPLGLEGLMAADAFSSFMALVAVFGSHMLMTYAAATIDDPDDFARFAAAGLAGTGAVVSTLYSVNLLALMILWEAAVAAEVGIVLMGKGDRVVEAAVKVSAMAMFSSLLMATGLGLLFAALGDVGVTLSSFNIPWVASHVSLVCGESEIVVLIAFALLVASLSIEVGAAPFYMWVPDMFSGAWPEAVSLVVTTVDLGGLYLLARITGMFARLTVSSVVAMGGLTPLLLALVVLSLFSMVLGEFSALGQTMVRRILGYSAVADAGYVLLLSTYFFWGGTVPFGEAAYSAQPLAYFVVASNLSISAAVATAGYLERRMGGLDLESFRGAARYHPLASVLLAISILSLIGVPPMAGFVAKFLVVSALVTAPTQAMLWVAAVATVLFVVSAAYGMRVLGTCARERDTPPPAVEGDWVPLVPIALIVVLLVVIGVNPSLLLSVFMR